MSKLDTKVLRIDRLLCELGHGTRNEVRDILRGGRVTINDKVIRDGATRVDISRNRIALDGEPIDATPAPIVMMNKPSGTLTAATDASRRTVVDLLPEIWRRRGLMPVGRLDMDTTGLLLFTDDGGLSHRLCHPKRHIDKLYRAVLDAAITDNDITTFAVGVQLKDFRALPAHLERDASDPAGKTAFITIQEGKYHQVKRMFGARGKTVLELSRLSIGPIMLDRNLEPGECRALTVIEEDALRTTADC